MPIVRPQIVVFWLANRLTHMMCLLATHGPLGECRGKPKLRLREQLGCCFTRGYFDGASGVDQFLCLCSLMPPHVSSLSVGYHYCRLVASLLTLAVAPTTLFFFLYDWWWVIVGYDCLWVIVSSSRIPWLVSPALLFSTDWDSRGLFLGFLLKRTVGPSFLLMFGYRLFLLWWWYDLLCRCSR